MKNWNPHRHQLVIVATLAVAVGACATSRVGSQEDAAPTLGAIPQAQASGEPDKVLARVINTREFRMEIRLLTTVHDVLLGYVSAYDTAVFEIPKAIVGPGRSVRLIADPIASSRLWVSSRVYLHLGDVMQWRIQGVATRTSGAMAWAGPVPLASWRRKDGRPVSDRALAELALRAQVSATG